MREQIKIDKNGALQIKRADKFVVQRCPYGEEASCGDWCPLLREPHMSPNTGLIQISLCHSEIICSSFVDERISKFPCTIVRNAPYNGNTHFIAIREVDDRYICDGGYEFLKCDCKIKGAT